MVNETISKNESKRENRWTKSIAVGSKPFLKRLKAGMRSMATGRRIIENKDGFELRESQSSYTAILDGKKADIVAENV